MSITTRAAEEVSRPFYESRAQSDGDRVKAVIDHAVALRRAILSCAENADNDALHDAALAAEKHFMAWVKDELAEGLAIVAETRANNHRINLSLPQLVALHLPQGADE